MEFNRRLSDKIIDAHKLACAEQSKAIADLLIEALQIDQTSIGGQAEEHREHLEMIEAAFELQQHTFG